jgi:isochorismate pyruvate lyase
MSTSEAFAAHGPWSGPDSGPDDESLDDLRAAVRALDARLVALAAERTRACRRIGELKRGLGAPVRNHGVERIVLANVRRAASGQGLDPTIAESLFRLLIEHSVELQLLDRAVANPDVAI